MTKVVLNDVSNPENQTSFVNQLNLNFTNIEEWSETVISRDGTSPNSMEADLDMNNNAIINLPAASTGGEPIRKSEFDTFVDDLDGAVSSAEASAIAAAASASSASSSASNASANASAASDAATDAQNAQTAAENALDEFTDLYLGAKASDPTLDNDGDALQDGALYFNTTTNLLMVYDLGTTTWLSAPEGPQGPQGDQPQIFVQNDEPTTSVPEDSLWIDANSTDVDLYQLQSGSWVDTGVNLKGPQGDTGPQGPAGSLDIGLLSQVTPETTDKVVLGDVSDSDTTVYSTVAQIFAANNGITASSADTLTNKTFDANGTGNSLSNVETADIASGSKTGIDSDLVTGTAGTNGNVSMWNSDGDLVDGSVVAANILVDGDIGSTVQAFDADTLKADTADVLTAGFATTVYDAGTQSGAGTYTPNEANGNFQKAVNGGAHTLAPPTNDSNIVIQYTNNGSAGAITTSGFTIVTGDDLSTVNGDDFIFYVTKINGFSHLNVVALQ